MPEEIPEREVFTVTDEELAEFSACSFRHLYRYAYHIEPPDVGADDLAVRATKESLLEMYEGLVSSPDGAVLSDIFQRFDRKVSERAARARIPIEKLANQLVFGRLRIQQHFDRLGRGGYTYLAAKAPYERSLIRPNKEIRVTGTIDLVRVRYDYAPKKRTLELVHFSTKRGSINKTERENSIEMVCSRLGLQKFGNYGKKRYSIVKNIFYSVHHDLEIEVQIEEQEMRNALGWVANVAEAVHRKLYFPQYDTIRCSGCPYKPACIPEWSSRENRDRPVVVRSRIEGRIGLLPQQAEDKNDGQSGLLGHSRLPHAEPSDTKAEAE